MSSGKRRACSLHVPMHERHDTISFDRRICEQKTPYICDMLCLSRTAPPTLHHHSVVEQLYNIPVLPGVSLQVLHKLYFFQEQNWWSQMMSLFGQRSWKEIAEKDEVEQYQTYFHQRCPQSFLKCIFMMSKASYSLCSFLQITLTLS